MLWQIAFFLLAFLIGTQYSRTRLRIADAAANDAAGQLEALRDSLQDMQAQQATARRDHMATAALQGLLASGRAAMHHPDVAAAAAYDYADALLKAGGHDA